MNDTNPFYSKYLKKFAAVMRRAIKMMPAVLFVFALSGCASAVKNTCLSEEAHVQPPDARVDELAQARDALEQQLHSEIVGKTAQLQVTDKGLVVTFPADALFDQGKSKLKTEAYAALDAVYRVLSGIASGSRIEIGGHTDNEAVQASGWKSGWELSAARALSVVHYFQDEKGIAGWRLSVAVFGEYRPVADNSTKEGRQANRRIEIVITPRMPQVQEIALPQTKTSEATQ